MLVVKNKLFNLTDKITIVFKNYLIKFLFFFRIHGNDDGRSVNTNKTITLYLYKYK